MLIAIHQPLFCPWFPYFEKLAQSDVFIMLTECQYEKNNNLNRQKVFGKWWTKPIQHGLSPIIDKYYISGRSMLALNVRWIYTIAETLDIDTKKIQYDFPTIKTGTERLIEICKHYKGDEYLADEKAPGRYLDVELMEKNGIKFIPFKSNYKKHVFEIFDEMGIEEACKLIKKGCRI